MTVRFQAQEQQAQLVWLQQAEFKSFTGMQDNAFQFVGDHRHMNLAPTIRDEAKSLFAHDDPAQRIQWHKFAGHGCSSQACCVSFLLPLAQHPEVLSEWIDHVAGVSGAQVEPIEDRHGTPRLIAFEWFPPDTDHLNEASKSGSKPRGANSTSVDAAIRYRLDGKVRLLLIEWKYIESYGDKRTDRERSGDIARDKRYHNLWKRPHGPLRADIGLELREFYLNPWYQLLRQQMLAYHAETDPLSCYSHVQLLHISPAANAALKTINGDAFRQFAGAKGLQEGTLFDVFTAMLDPRFADRFRSIDIASAFAPVADHPLMHETSAWLRARYPNLFIPEDAA